MHRKLAGFHRAVAPAALALSMSMLFSSRSVMDVFTHPMEDTICIARVGEHNAIGAERERHSASCVATLSGQQSAAHFGGLRHLRFGSTVRAPCASLQCPLCSLSNM